MQDWGSYARSHYPRRFSRANSSSRECAAEARCASPGLASPFDETHIFGAHGGDCGGDGARGALAQLKDEGSPEIDASTDVLDICNILTRGFDE